MTEPDPNTTAPQDPSQTDATAAAQAPQADPPQGDAPQPPACTATAQAPDGQDETSASTDLNANMNVNAPPPQSTSQPTGAAPTSADGSSNPFVETAMAAAKLTSLLRDNPDALKFLETLLACLKPAQPTNGQGGDTTPSA